MSEAKRRDGIGLIISEAADGSKYVPRFSQREVVFEGGCRCGGVRYTSTAPPSGITLCHCRACQQLSGSGFLPFVDVEDEALEWTHTSTLKTLNLTKSAERTFCSGCGTPIAMSYHADKRTICVVFGSVNLDGYKGELPTVKQ